MTPRALRSRISKCPAQPPITTRYERDLEKTGSWSRSSAWYASQKEHWLGWLGEYNGPGYYGRKESQRTAEFVYNHIVCPPMVLWLGEACGIPTATVRKAMDAALSAKSSLAAQAAAVRKVIPWALIEAQMSASRPRKAGHRIQALLVRSPFVEMILDGKKTWEIRGSRTTIRGQVGLIRSGSGEIVGTCEVVDCLGPLTADQYRKNAAKAGLTQSEAKLGYYKKTFAWVLANPRRLKAPVPYHHPSGAVIWVKLGARTERQVQLSRKLVTRHQQLHESRLAHSDCS